MNTAQDLPRLLPSVLQKAEEETARVAMQAREDLKTMSTHRVARPGPMTPYALAMDIARQMPFVALIGYFLYTVDARNEKNSAARFDLMKETNQTLVGVVQTNTVVMQRSVDSADRNEKNIAEILRHVSAMPSAPKKLGE